MTQENVSNQGKGAIFDLDGTLLDSMGVWDQVDVDFLAKLWQMGDDNDLRGLSEFRQSRAKLHP